MKKIIVAVAALTVGASMSNVAQADTDVFGMQQQIDGSFNIRQTTTEQFDPVRGESVLTRPRPDFDPTPISVDSFQLFPSLDVSEAYNSNIFTQPNVQTADAITTVDPSVSVQSNWGRHALALLATGDINYYAWNNAQNFNSAVVQAQGRYDISEQTWLAGSAGYQRVTELRGSPSAPINQVGPSQYNLYSANASAYRGVGVVTAKLDYSVDGYEYAPFDLIGGGSESQSDRDRLQNSLESEFSYDLGDNLKPYVRLGYNWRDYDLSDQRSSNGYNLDVGARADFGGIVTAQAYLGYIAQDYYNFVTSERSNHTVGDMDFGADILWNVTELTSVEAKAAHSIEELDITGASSYIANTGGVTVSHELLRNVILESTVSYTSADYQGIVQQEGYYNVSGGARYFINRNLHTDLTYNYQRKDSTVQGEDFDQHVVMLRVGLQY